MIGYYFDNHPEKIREVLYVPNNLVIVFEDRIKVHYSPTMIKEFDDIFDGSLLELGVSEGLIHEVDVSDKEISDLSKCCFDKRFHEADRKDYISYCL